MTSTVSTKSNKNKLPASRNLKHEELLVETTVGSVFCEHEHSFESRRTFKGRTGVDAEAAKLFTMNAKTIPTKTGPGIGILRKIADGRASGGGGGGGESARSYPKDIDATESVQGDGDAGDDDDDETDDDDDTAATAHGFKPLRAYRYSNVKVIRRSLVLQPSDAHFQNQYNRTLAHEQAHVQTMW